MSANYCKCHLPTGDQYKDIGEIALKKVKRVDAGKIDDSEISKIIGIGHARLRLRGYGTKKNL